MPNPSNPIDPVSLLEKRIDGLIHHLDGLVQENDELRRENAILEKRHEDQAARILKLEDDMHAQGQKEHQVRDRLMGLLKKIDSMEEVLTGQSAAE